MNLTLTLLPHQAAELQRRATAAGTDLPYEHWRVLFREWLQGHRPRKTNLHDSRESIYD